MIFDFTKSLTSEYQLYEEDKSRYGFITQENCDLTERMRMPELGSGMLPACWTKGYKLSEIKSDSEGYYVNYDGDGEVPLTFAAAVDSEGNYLVRVQIYSSMDIEEGMIFLGRRCLAKVLRLKTGETFTGEYLTSVRPIIPRGYAEREEDRTVDITVVGKGLHLSKVEIEKSDSPTLYIAGDSTVTDQSAEYPYLPERSYCGWGQMISAFLGTQITVSNHAHSGLTTESFRSEGHYDIVYERIKENDIFLMQFGHNDQKLDELKAEEGYRNNLIRYIDELRTKGAIPVIVTPLARNSWKGNDGSYNDLLSDYAAACKRVAKEKDVLFIDLHQKSMELVISLGCIGAKRYFYPSDYTHSNDYGAFLFAQYVCEGLKEIGLNLTQGEMLIPREASEIREIRIPDECMKMSVTQNEPLFEDLQRPDDYITRAETFEMVIRTMKYFPTNVYNDMFTDVIGHETYAGSIECAYQNGLIPDDFVQNGKIEPEKYVTGRDFLEILSTGYRSRTGESISEDAVKTSDFEPDGYLKRGVAASICESVQI